MQKMKPIVLVAVVGVLATSVAGAQAAKSAKAATSAAETYCTGTGGQVEVRIPVYNTNGPITAWLKLAGTEEFCQYLSAADHSRIHLSLQTLYTTQPSLAALAYYSQTAWDGKGQGNPASLYCTQLGGSDLFGGATAAGGGWVKTDSIDEVLEACIFPDNSTIDSWGLFYHSDGTIRGIDLSTVLRYANPYAAASPKKP